MEVDKIIRNSKLKVFAGEKEINSLVEASKKLFLQQESRYLLSYRDFILTQFKMIQKRWWLFQFIILCLAWQILASEEEVFYIHRSMGIFASLFVILFLPELWRNITNRCIEIEMTSFYSLNKIYAARLMLFGGVDIFFLTVFSGGVYFILGVSITDLIIQFLLPAAVTACICLIVFSTRNKSKGLTIGLCSAWTILWWMLATNEVIYSFLAGPIWLAFFLIVCSVLFFTIYKFFKNYREGDFYGTVAD